MGDSVYKSKNLTTDQMLFIKKIDELEIDFFLLNRIESDIGVQFKNLNEVLENLEQKGFLKRIEKGKYVRSIFNDPYVIGNLLIEESAIAYWSALHLHGLTPRFPNVIFLQSTKRKNNKRVFGVEYKFVFVSNRKFQGIIENGYGNLQYRITDINKTIVDCFDLPQYSGGFTELVQAFSSAKSNSRDLINYAESINNIAAIKRMGFLAELFNIDGSKQFIRWAKKQINSAYNLLDPGGLQEGEFNKDWNLRLNIDKERLISLVNEVF